jgi:hypothetical protein
MGTVGKLTRNGNTRLKLDPEQPETINSFQISTQLYSIINFAKNTTYLEKKTRRCRTHRPLTAPWT